MKMLLAPILLISLQVVPSSPLPSPTRLGTVLRIPNQVVGAGYSSLVTVARTNHVALGIVLDDSRNKDVCNVPMNLGPGDLTVGSLIAILNSRLSGQKASLQNGVINITPVSIPKGTAKLLDLRIKKFESNAITHSSQGDALWMYIRGTIVPGQASFSAGPMSTQSERVGNVSANEQTVKTVLNVIVAQGNRGAWMLRVAEVGTPLSTSPQPYEVYDYQGSGAQLQEKLGCAR